MTIDESIKHCLEVVKKNEQAKKDGNLWIDTEYEDYCADHRQLAEWLTELQQWRRVYGVCPSYEMCIPECKEGYNAQISELKKLLNLALEDMHKIVNEYTGCEGLCEFCQKTPKQCQNGLIWRYCAKLYPFIGDMVNMED